LLYGNNIVMLIMYTDILLHLYPVYSVDVATVTITDYPSVLSNMYLN